MASRNGEGWAPLTDEQRALVNFWLVAWNSATQKDISLQEGALARDSCKCGSCPSFEVYPLDLEAAQTTIRTMDVGASLRDAKGDVVAGVVVFASAESTDFEVYPLADGPVTLNGMTFENDA